MTLVSVPPLSRREYALLELAARRLAEHAHYDLACVIEDVLARFPIPTEITMTRVTFPIGGRVRHKPTGRRCTIERPAQPDQWWVTWRDGPLVRRAMYRAGDLELEPLGASAVDPVRDQTATPPSTFDATFPLSIDASSSSAPDPTPDPTPDTGGGGDWSGGGGDFGGGGSSGEW